jgi:hypothetical protein
MSNLLERATLNVATSFGSAKGGKGLNIKGYVVRSNVNNRSYQDKTDGKTKTFTSVSFLVRIIGLPPAQQKPSKNAPFVVSADGQSVRINESGVSSTKNADVFNRYMADITNHNSAEVAALFTPVNLSDLAGTKFKNPNCYRFKMNVAPYNKEPIINLCLGSVVWVNIKSDKPPSRGSIVNMEGVELGVYAPKEYADDSMGDGSTNLLKLNLNATVVTPLKEDAEMSKLPVLYKHRKYINFGGPWYNPLLEPTQGSASHLFALQLTNEGVTTKEPGKLCGRLVTPCQPARSDPKTSEILQHDNPATYRMGDIDNRRTHFPANAKIVNWQSVHVDDTALADALRRQGYSLDDETNPDTPDLRTWVRPYAVRFDIWSDNVHKSGISDFNSWCNVNSFAPIPVDALLRIAKNASGEDMVMTVEDCSWDMESYLTKYGVEVSHNLGLELLGNQTTLTCNLGAEIRASKSGNEPFDIVNIPNLEFTKKLNDFLINLSEWNGPIPDLSDPAQKWKMVVLIVPTATNLRDKKARLEILREKAKALISQSRVEGVDKDDLIANFVRGNSPPDTKISELSGSIGDFSYMVFAIRSVADHFSKDLLEKRFFTPATCVLTEESLVVPAPKRQREEEEEEPEEEEEEKEQGEAMDIDDNNAPAEAGNAEGEQPEPPRKRVKREESLSEEGRP